MVRVRKSLEVGQGSFRRAKGGREHGMGYGGCMVRWILTQPRADLQTFWDYIHDYIFSRKKFKGLFHGPLAE